MTQVNVHQAKTSLSRLIARVEAGEEVIIARDGKPCAKMVPIHSNGHKRIGFGDLRGKIKYSDDVHLPMSDEELGQFYNDPHLQPAKRKKK